MKWWEAPEYDRRQPMNFPAPDPHAPMARIGTEVAYDDQTKRWVATPIRIFVGPSHF